MVLRNNKCFQFFVLKGIQKIKKLKIFYFRLKA